MPFTYPIAPVVAPGDFIRSEQAYAQADAMNARLKLGPSCPWRVVYYLLSAFRQVRNPFGDLYPPQGEFFTVYQNLNPEDATWPVQGPGESEGANVNSQMPLFVYGVDHGRFGFYGEADRLTNPGAGGIDLDQSDPASGNSPRGLWNLAKSQRGAWDPNTGGLGSPALQAAVSHGYIRYSATSPHGVDYGGYLPSPTRVGDCADPGGDTAPPQNYTIIFTKLDGSGTTLTYGTCPENAGDLAAVYQTPFAYLLFLFGGQVISLPATKWVEGPYTSDPALRKTQNYFLDRAVNAFLGDFRGTPAQQEEGGLSHGFNFQTFLTRQYHLAPQRGQEITGSVEPRYRQMSASGSRILPASTLLSGAATVTSAFVVTGFYFEGKGLAQPCTVEVYRDTAKVTEATLEKQSDNTWQALAILDNQTPGGAWSVHLQTDAEGAGTITLSAEFTELMPYQPSAADAYLVLRCGAGQFSGATDGDGTRCEVADAIADRYFETGTITNLAGHVALPGQDQEINSNAVFDAARRLSQCVRWIPRDNLLKYGLEDGVSVLYFKRLAYGLGNATPIDLFQAIAPARRAVTSIKWGRTYKVVGTGRQSVLYAQQSYSNGMTFVGQAGIDTFTGDAAVWEVEGIRHTAEPESFTNEWLLGCELLPYKNSNSSIWKPDAYADVVGPVDRCIFGDPGAAVDKQLAIHLAFGNRTISPPAILEPEAPDAYRYMPANTGSYRYLRVNQIACTEGDTDCEARRQAFYASCRLFEPWPEIDSVTLDAQDVVKVKLKTRLHHCPSAPGTISVDPTTWNKTALAAEPYRTWENGIREYILWQTTGYGGSQKVGDQAWASGVASSFSDQPQSTIFPRFYLVQQIPKPRVDGNALVNSADSPTYHDIQRQTELYLRAICSAFVDGFTTAATACTTNTAGPYDFTFEALCYQAWGGKWFSPLASKETPYLSASDIRSDKPMGFGPLPTVTMHAEGFSNISRALNLLNRFRVMIPATVQSRGAVLSTNYADANIKNANMDIVPPGGQTTSGVGTYAVWDQGTWAIPQPVDSDWYPWGDLVVGSGIESGAGINGVAIVSGNGVVTASHSPAQYRWAGQVDTDLALPTPFSGMLTSYPVIYGTYTETTTTVLGHQQVAAYAGTQCHQIGGGADNVWGNTGGAWYWAVNIVTTAPKCMEITSGDLSIGSIPYGYTFGTRNDLGTTTLVPGGNAKKRDITLGQDSIPVIAVPLVAPTAPTPQPVL